MPSFFDFRVTGIRGERDLLGSLRGPQVPAGARVRITGVDGTVLIVDSLPG